MNPTYAHRTPSARRDFGADLSDGTLPDVPVAMTGLSTLTYIALLPRQSWPALNQDCRRCKHSQTCADFVFARQITICEAAAIARGDLAPFEPPIFNPANPHAHPGKSRH